MHSILVVDDDPHVREVLEMALSSPGFVVHTAADAYEAVRVLVDRQVDVLITDIRMPEMSGFELARQAKVMRPHLRVIYMTGHYEAKDEVGDPAAGVLLFKPFRPADLVHELQRELSLESDRTAPSQFA